MVGSYMEQPIVLFKKLNIETKVNISGGSAFRRMRRYPRDTTSVCLDTFTRFKRARWIDGWMDKTRRKGKLLECLIDRASIVRDYESSLSRRLMRRYRWKLRRRLKRTFVSNLCVCGPRRRRGGH